MLERSLTASRALALDPGAIQAGEKVSADAYKLKEGTLTVNPGGELQVPVRPALPLNPNMVMELSVRTERIPEEALPQVKPPPGPAVPETGTVEYGGIRIASDPSLVPLPDWQPPAPPQRVDDMQVLFVQADGKTIPLPELADFPEFKKIQVPVGEMAGTLESLAVRNRNTHRRIVVRDIAVFDKTQRGDFVPTRALAEAGDALLEMDGIEVRRPTNSIDDLVPGVTLTLKGPSSVPGGSHHPQGRREHRQADPLAGGILQPHHHGRRRSHPQRPHHHRRGELPLGRGAEKGLGIPRPALRGPRAAAAEELAADDE